MNQQIVENLSKYSNDRGFTLNKQREGYHNNVQEEIMEYIVAKNDYEKIDAICDIAVYTLNVMKDSSKKGIELFLLEEEVGKSSFGKALDLIRDGAFSEQSLKYMLNVCYSLAYKKGFDFEKAMDETIKEISSRTGTWSEERKKWVKDTSPEAKSRWYKANYEKARLN